MEIPDDNPNQQGDQGQLNRHALNDLLSGPKRQMTKTAFAEKMDVARTTMSKWLAGHWSPGFSVVQQMAEILDVDIDRLWLANHPTPQQQDMYTRRLNELIESQPEHVRAKILSMVTDEIARREREQSDKDDRDQDDE